MLEGDELKSSAAFDVEMAPAAWQRDKKKQGDAAVYGVLTLRDRHSRRRRGTARRAHKWPMHHSQNGTF
jgi:hypothetical protein